MRKGITKIKIPVKPNELSISVIEKYLDSVFGVFETNSISIRQDYDKYCLDHKILKKVRVHDDSEVNNIVLIPDLNSMVEWKTGYVCGNPIKYSQTKDLTTDDMTYLNKYVRSSVKRAVDKEVCKWAYATGVGYYFIEPKSYAFDIDEESPFEIYCRDADTCCKVYSSYGGEKPLFDILYTTIEEIDEQGKKNTIKILDIYTESTLYTFKKEQFKQWVLVENQDRGLYRYLPLVEKRPNSDGIGIVAKGESLQNAIDGVLSDCLDNVGDIVNEVWVYYNMLLGDTPQEKANFHKNARKSGAIEAIANNTELQPKVETISTKLSLTEVMELFTIINQKFHSSLGVPMEMSSTNSGGTTKQGSEVANGYDNAYNKAIDDINTFIVGDTQLLERIMWICKNTPNNKIDNISASDIEIKYVLNLTDNILTKTQSFVNLIQAGVPYSMALRICRLSNDAEAEGKQIEEYIANKKAEELKRQQSLVKQTQQQENNNGNNSQE